MNQNDTKDDAPAGYLTPDEAIAFLRLDAAGGDARERLRNLIRRHGLPVIRRGPLRLFRPAALEAWLAAGERGRRTFTPARLDRVVQSRQQVTAK
jgi:hypothetical protein